MWIQLRQLVDQQLAQYVDRGDDCPNELRDAMRYSLLAGGKRLRPVLVLLSCEACGGTKEAGLPAACAIEMVHTYSLIHDDLPAMDDDDLRRGRPTSHVVFGEAMAILAGDALLTLAFEVIASDVQPKAVAASICADLAAAAGSDGMVGGQVADMQAEKKVDSKFDANKFGEVVTADPSDNLGSEDVTRLTELKNIHRRKTGRLITSSLTIGAQIAQTDAETVNLLRNFGKCVGLAFQITDDLLDISGNEKKMGKGVRKDAQHGKLTYPALMGVDASRKMASDLVDQACQWIAPLGKSGQRLEALAQFVLERDH